MSDTEKTGALRRGRPLSFHRDDALDQAVLVFWDKGYDGASINDLTKAMGINPPSLYSAFGSKRGLFMAAIDRYAGTYGRRPFDAFCFEPDIRNAVASLFDKSIRCATEDGKPRGCLIASVASVEAHNDAKLRDKLAAMFAGTDAAIADRFRSAWEDGQRACVGDPAALAAMVASVTHSIATRARSGASRKELSELAGNFIKIFFPQPA